MSRVQYEQLPIDLSDVGEVSEAESTIQNRIGEYLRGLSSNGCLEHAVLRIRLTGATPLCAELDSMVSRLRENFDCTAGDVSAVIDCVVNDTSPELDLAELAQRHDPPGVLAGFLLQLRDDQVDETGQRVLDEAIIRIQKVQQHGSYVEASTDLKPNQDETKEHLFRAGMLLLATLQSQRGQ